MMKILNPINQGEIIFNEYVSSTQERSFSHQFGRGAATYHQHLINVLNYLQSKVNIYRKKNKEFYTVFVNDSSTNKLY